MRFLPILAAAISLFAAACLFGCSSQPADRDAQSSPEAVVGTTVLEETISPNEQYVDSEADIVHYTVRVTQTAPDMATVSTESNSGFFEPVSYDVECDGELSASDVSVTWTTLMGNPEPSEDDQLAIAVVSVRTADGGTDERKISFATGAIKMAAEAIPAA